MKVLVTGGAGYIGSHTTLKLLEENAEVVVCDNLSRGYREMVLGGEFHRCDIADPCCEALFKRHRFDAVMHFAAFCSVPESIEQPLLYYQQNTAVTMRLLQLCRQYHVDKFIFSSTAAVYGVAENIPISEDEPLLPVNPYGESKLFCEKILDAVAQSGRFNYVALRYFNVAGADPDTRIGQRGGGHIIKNICRTLCASLSSLQIFGTDYDSKDGTCVRDYIHVLDIADAHIAALNYLLVGGKSVTLNCGYGHGYSVREVCAAAEKVGGSLATIIAPRRTGDPPELVANNKRIRHTLDWQPQHDNLEEIIADALRWERRLSELR